TDRDSVGLHSGDSRCDSALVGVPRRSRWRRWILAIVALSLHSRRDPANQQTGAAAGLHLSAPLGTGSRPATIGHWPDLPITDLHRPADDGIKTPAAAG